MEMVCLDIVFRGFGTKNELAVGRKLQAGYSILFVGLSVLERHHWRSQQTKYLNSGESVSTNYCIIRTMLD
jgi:hypothetical protein